MTGSINPIKLYNEFKGYTNKLETDINVLSLLKLGIGSPLQVKVSDMQHHIDAARADKENYSTFMGRHWFLGRVFQVIKWSWKNESKTQAAIDDFMQALPQNIREQIDAQKESSQKTSSESNKPDTSGKEFPQGQSKSNAVDRAEPKPPFTSEQELEELFGQIRAALNSKDRRCGKEVASAVIDKIDHLDDIDKKLKTARNVYLNIPSLIIEGAYDDIAEAMLKDEKEFQKTKYYNIW